MKSVKFLLTALAALVVSAVFASKPVGLLYGNSYKRLAELTAVTIFNPQWSKDKPLTVPVNSKNIAASLNKISVLVYIHGNNIFRFREFSAPVVAKVEEFVRNGGIFVVLVDGGQNPGVTQTKQMAKLLGASKYATLTGKPDIVDPAWKECGAIPEVFEHMLSPVPIGTTWHKACGNTHYFMVVIEFIDNGMEGVEKHSVKHAYPCCKQNAACAAR